MLRVGPPKKLDVDLESGCEHEHQPPKIGEELHDRVVYPIDAENMWPQKKPNDYQPHKFRNSEAACKRLYADDERQENRELGQVRQGQYVRPECIKPFHGRPTSDTAGPSQGVPGSIMDWRGSCQGVPVSRRFAKRVRFAPASETLTRR
jgi:hypothetical protein